VEVETLKAKGKFLMAGLFLILFAVLILLVKKVNVAAIGPEGTSIGLSDMNKSFHEMTGENHTLYKISEYLGYAALALVGVFGLVGLVQLIRRRSLLKVDHEILALGGLYVVVLGLYFVFEKIVINYRPVIMEGDAHVEASFPSSHTMLAIVVLGSTLMVISKYVKNDGLRVGLEMLCIISIVLLVLGRLLCGVHWLTDIIGGVLISGALLFAFAGVKDLVTKDAVTAEEA
jgi:undecaprenyl-diphosphatase